MPDERERDTNTDEPEPGAVDDPLEKTFREGDATKTANRSTPPKDGPAAAGSLPG